MTVRGAVVLALIALSLAAGCANGVTGGTGTDGVGVAEPHPGGTGNPADALAAWQGFPVDRQPRPIVPAAALVQFAGYTTGEAKIAAMLGSYRVTVPFPPDPSPGTVPVIGAAAAVDRMRAAGDPKGGGGQSPPPPLEIVGFELGTAPVLTDRGTLTLPVWRVHTADEVGPTVVLAVADSAMYRPSSLPPDSYLMDPGIKSAVLSADGRRLTLTVNEADPQCPGEAVYQSTPKLTQSPSVVVVSFAVTQTGTVPGNTQGGCPAILHLRTATYPVDLDAPLGARVVVNADAVPVPVTTG